MPKRLPQDIKERIIAKYKQGLKAEVIAEHLMVSERTVYTMINQYKKDEDLTLKTQPRKKPSYNERHKQITAEKPDIT